MFKKISLHYSVSRPLYVSMPWCTYFSSHPGISNLQDVTLADHAQHSLSPYLNHHCFTALLSVRLFSSTIPAVEPAEGMRQEPPFLRKSCSGVSQV